MMSDGKSYFDKILETNPEFLNWAKVSYGSSHTNRSRDLHLPKKEAMFFPPDRSESVPKYIERRLVERNWPSEIEKVLVLIRDESNGQFILVWRCLRFSLLLSFNECFVYVTQSNRLMAKPLDQSAHAIKLQTNTNGKLQQQSIRTAQIQLIDPATRTWLVIIYDFAKCLFIE